MPLMVFLALLLIGGIVLIADAADCFEGGKSCCIGCKSTRWWLYFAIGILLATANALAKGGSDSE